MADDKLLSEDSGELQFINLSSNYSGDPNTKKVVRKHVMSKFRRDQRKEQSSAPKSKTPREVSGNQSKLPKPGKANKVTTVSPSTDIRPIEKSPLNDSQPRQILIRRNGYSAPETDIQDESQHDAPQNETQLVRLPTNIGAGRDDPFDSLPMPNSPQTAYLLDHCK